MAENSEADGLSRSASVTSSSGLGRLSPAEVAALRNQTATARYQAALTRSNSVAGLTVAQANIHPLLRSSTLSRLSTHPLNSDSTLRSTATGLARSHTVGGFSTAQTTTHASLTPNAASDASAPSIRADPHQQVLLADMDGMRSVTIQVAYKQRDSESVSEFGAAQTQAVQDPVAENLASIATRALADVGRLDTERARISVSRRSASQHHVRNRRYTQQLQIQAGIDTVSAHGTALQALRVEMEELKLRISARDEAELKAKAEAEVKATAEAEAEAEQGCGCVIL